MCSFYFLMTSLGESGLAAKTNRVIHNYCAVDKLVGNLIMDADLSRREMIFCVMKVSF